MTASCGGTDRGAVCNAGHNRPTVATADPSNLDGDAYDRVRTTREI